MIVVTPNGMVRMAPDPGNAGTRFEGVVYQVTQAQANVVGFIESLQRRPITMNIGQHKDAHTERLS
jgi:hypothetical protein